MTKSEAYTALGFDLPLAAGWLDEIVDFHELDKYCNWPKPCTVKSYQQIEQELEAGTYEYPAPAHIDFYRLYSRVMHQVQDLNQLWMEDAAADQAADRPVKWQEDGKNAPLFLLAYLLLSDSSKFCVRVPGGIKNAAAVFNSTVDVLQAGCNRQHRKVASFSWDDLKPDGRTNKWGGTSVGVGMHSDGVATNLLNVNHRWDYTMCASSTWFETGASEELPEQLTPPEFAQVLGSFAQQAVDTLVGGESAGPMSSREWWDGTYPTERTGTLGCAIDVNGMRQRYKRDEARVRAEEIANEERAREAAMALERQAKEEGTTVEELVIRMEEELVGQMEDEDEDCYNSSDSLIE